MAYDYTLTGHLRYRSKEAAQQALASLTDLLQDDDPDFAEALKASFDDIFSLDGETLTVDLTIYAPADFWFSLEALAETLADPAEAGFLQGDHELFDDGPERFYAGGEVEEA